MSPLEQKLINQAKLIAPNLPHRCKHISFIISRNKILSIGVNSYNKTSPLAKKYSHLGAFVHSELSAIVNAPRESLSRYSIYNVRIGLDGSVKISKPCEACQKLLIGFDLKRCYYTTDEGFFERFF